MDQDEYALDHEMLEAMVSVLRDAPTLTEMEVRHRDVTVRIRRPGMAAAPAQQPPAVSKAAAAAQHSMPAAAGQGRNGNGQAVSGNGGAAASASGAVTSSASRTAAAAERAAEAAAETVLVTAGLVGIFRAMPQPIAPGYTVKAKQVIGYIEAMRLMNECITPVTGVVADVLIHDGQPVEYGQPLFEIDPGGTGATAAAASGAAAAAGEEAGK